MPRITLYETNPDLIYAQKDGGPIWFFGVVTADMHGKFAEDAQAWCDGDWEPSENDGQHDSALSPDDLDAVATWEPTWLAWLVERDQAGFAARMYVAGEC
jgi:hypothetical protein